MDIERIYHIKFSMIYPLYVQKVQRKGRSQEELDRVLCWFTGYTRETLMEQVDKQVSLEIFFQEAPKMHPAAGQIKGVICGVRIEDIEDPLIKRIRQMDKLVDELAKGRAMEKILRNGKGKEA